MASFENVYVQAAREWLLTQGVAGEWLVLFSVKDGAATYGESLVFGVATIF